MGFIGGAGFFLVSAGKPDEPNKLKKSNKPDLLCAICASQSQNVTTPDWRLLVFRQSVRFIERWVRLSEHLAHLLSHCHPDILPVTSYHIVIITYYFIDGLSQTLGCLAYQLLKEQ
jgi:hypothetical protein